MCYPVGVYLWRCIFIVAVTHLIIVFSPGFAAMPPLVDVRQPHEGDIVLVCMLCLRACCYVHTMWKDAARASKVIFQDVKAAGAKQMYLEDSLARQWRDGSPKVQIEIT